MNNKSNRIEWVDIARGIALVFVLLTHCYHVRVEFCFWFYSFMMATFFVLSGYTFKTALSYKEFFRHKIYTLLIPYVFMAAVCIVFWGGLAVTHGNSYNIMNELAKYTVQIRHTALWFLPCLFLAEQIMYVICYQIKKKACLNVVYLYDFLLFFCLYFIYLKFIGIRLPWNADLSILAIAFMLLGKYLNHSEGLENKKICFLGGMISFIIGYINYRYFSYIDWFDDKFGNPVLFCICSVSGVVSVIGASKILENKKCKLKKVIIYLGKNSMIYYGLHRCVLEMIYVIYYKIGLNLEINSVLALIMAFVAMVITCLLLTPVNEIILRFLPWCIGKTIIEKEKHD